MTAKRAALITGGASGIGKATARRLLSDGASVTIADLGQDRIDAAAGELKS
ncbi:MAG TPA: SDR family NAD(P)-dependent oxidoreductase, partial [Vicinamibacteria bacterium]